MLTDDYMTRYISASLQVLTLYHEHGKDILDRVITREDTWLHYHTPPTKQTNKIWLKKGECPQVKAKTERFVKEHMVTVFWYRKGVILTSFMQGTIINIDTYPSVT